jgi:hypothetical protein
VLGLTGWAMILWRLAFAAGAVAVVWRVFRRPGEPGLRLAALLGGGILLTPYAMHYDGSLLVPAAVAMAVGGLDERGWLLRLLALGAVCEVAAPNLGALMVTAFIALSLIAAAPERLAAPAVAT